MEIRKGKGPYKKTPIACHLACRAIFYVDFGFGKAKEQKEQKEVFILH